MNRGSTQPGDSRRACPSCFNEAPIHESGKWCQGGRGPLVPLRFNEAPIHESGKCRS